MVEPARCHFCLDMGCDMCSPSEKSGGEAPRSFSGLRADEQERLALLAEEMGEVIQVIGKILRHGYDSINPDLGLSSPNNRSLLEKELGDVGYAMTLMSSMEDFQQANVMEHTAAAVEKKGKWLHHQVLDLGELAPYLRKEAEETRVAHEAAREEMREGIRRAWRARQMRGPEPK